MFYYHTFKPDYKLLYDQHKGSFIKKAKYICSVNMVNYLHS